MAKQEVIEAEYTVPLPEKPTDPAPNGYLSLESILSADDIKYEDVECPEWGGKVLVKSLNGRERATWQQSSIIGDGKKQSVNFQRTTVELVRLGVVDHQTKRPYFTSAHVAALAQKNSAPLERIATVVMRLSGIGQEELDVITKNSEETPSDD